MMKKKQYYLLLLMTLLAFSILNAAPKVIKIGDVVSVWVKGEPELTVEREVGADGSITYPLIGKIGMNNLTTTEAAKVIAQLLEDGYLQNPLVQVSIKSAATRQSAPKTIAAPLSEIKAEKTISTTTPILLEVIDKSTRKGVGGAAMMLGNRIYQSNRLGQILVEEQTGRVVIIADGYQILDADMSKALKPGNPFRIYLEPVKFPEEIVFHVLDAFNRQPISDVEVRLDQMKITTNRNGTFKIRKLQKEFGELTLTKKGYKAHRMVVDFKGPTEQLILMVRND